MGGDFWEEIRGIFWNCAEGDEEVLTQGRFEVEVFEVGEAVFFFGKLSESAFGKRKIGREASGGGRHQFKKIGDGFLVAKGNEGGLLENFGDAQGGFGIGDFVDALADLKEFTVKRQSFFGLSEPNVISASSEIIE